MMGLVKGRYRARLARGPDDIASAQALRGRAFGQSVNGSGLDIDGFDRCCDHVLIEDTAQNTLVCCFRFLLLSDGADIETSYAAQYYDLGRLRAFRGPMVEMGRFCVDPKVSDPDILRIAWAAMTAYVDLHRVELLFGCVSFAGTDPAPYADAFGSLASRHLAPDQWRPKVKACEFVPLAGLAGVAPDPKQAGRMMPPLLRTYLMMGGWVSDHAVIDHRMKTLHVFTGVEIALIPAARKRLLRAVVG